MEMDKLKEQFKSNGKDSEVISHYVTFLFFYVNTGAVNMKMH